MKCYFCYLNVAKISTEFLRVLKVPVSLSVCWWQDDIETLTHHLRMVTHKCVSWLFVWELIKWHRSLTAVLKEKCPGVVCFSHHFLRITQHCGGCLWKGLIFICTQDVYCFTCFYINLVSPFKSCSRITKRPLLGYASVKERIFKLK